MAGQGRIEFIPIRVPIQRAKFDLVETILRAVEEAGEGIRDQDILAISSKFVAMSEGRIVKLVDIHPSREARRLAEEVKMSSRIAELVLREAEVVFGGIPGFALALKDGVLSPNAGIDRSNIYPGYVILHPGNPFHRAEEVRQQIFKKTGRRIGVILTDSRLLPTRIGTIGVAIGVAGFEPVRDERGRKDLFGRRLKVTRRALADDISAGAQLLMGEADEGVPVVIVRGLRASPLQFTERRLSKEDLTVDYRTCIYIRGLSKGRVIPGKGWLKAS